MMKYIGKLRLKFMKPIDYSPTMIPEGDGTTQEVYYR